MTLGLNFELLPFLVWDHYIWLGFICHPLTVSLLHVSLCYSTTNNWQWNIYDWDIYDQICLWKQFACFAAYFYTSVAMEVIGRPKKSSRLLTTSLFLVSLEAISCKRNLFPLKSIVNYPSSNYWLLFYPRKRPFQPVSTQCGCWWYSEGLPDISPRRKG